YQRSSYWQETRVDQSVGVGVAFYLVAGFERAQLLFDVRHIERRTVVVIAGAAKDLLTCQRIGSEDIDGYVRDGGIGCRIEHRVAGRVAAQESLAINRDTALIGFGEAAQHRLVLLDHASRREHRGDLIRN